MAQEDFPVRGRDDYRSFIDAVTSGRIRADRVFHDVSVVGTRQVRQDVFVLDPAGDVEVDDGQGGKLRGRREARTVTVQTFRPNKIQYEDERAPKGRI